MENTEERKRLPKYAFDTEYMTEFLREVRFLTERGIQPTYTKKTPDYGITQYKYRKTPTLFATLVEFYSMIESERRLRIARYGTPKVEEKVTEEEIKKAQETLDKAAKQSEEKQDDTI